MDYEHKPTSPGDSSEDQQSSRPVPTSPGGPTHSGSSRDRSFPTSPGEPDTPQESSRTVPTSPGGPTGPDTPHEPGEQTPGTEPIHQPYEPEPDPESPFEVDSARHRQVDEQEQRVAEERFNHKETPR